MISQHLGLALLLAMVCAGPVAAQQPESPPASQGSAEAATEAPGADTDPTKPVLLSIRDEYSALPGDLRRNIVMFRGDALAFKTKKLPGRARGLLLRADLPFVSFDDGVDTTRGLGDLYGQALLVPRVSPKFTVAFGSGLVLPTATDDPLGRGKWIVAPAVAPIWFFLPRGYAFVKLQDWISVAGDDARPDVHYLTITPTWLCRIGKKWWTLVDAESTTNWTMDDHTSFRAGFLMGRMHSPRHGVSLKVEVPFGGYQQTDWALKAVFFRTKY